MTIRKCAISLVGICTFYSLCLGQQLPRRQLRVVMYPFIPEYRAVLYDVKTSFERRHPDIHLVFADLSSNYYSPGSLDFIGNAKADVYELDSVFLSDFVKTGKIQALPPAALLQEDQLLRNAAAGSRVGNTRYGAAHWVCGNFLFFKAGDNAISSVGTLSDLEHVIGSPNHPKGQGVMVDLKGKSTLGEFYLETAFDRFGNWNAVSGHLSSMDSALQANLIQLAKLCDAGYCRNGTFHAEKPGIYGRQFARGNGRALIGYSETLHEVLSETNEACSPDDKCLGDGDIDVVKFPSDDTGSHQMSWVDSYVMDVNCTHQCADDAVAFIAYMNSDEVNRQILLHEGAAPAYLLPARQSWYSDGELLQAAHLYPKLRAIIENAAAPSAIGLNQNLRKIGGDLDKHLP